MPSDDWLACAEAPIPRLSIAAVSGMQGAVHGATTTRPKAASRPYVSMTATVSYGAEGAGVVVLEVTRTAPRPRGANVSMPKSLGYGMSGVAFHITRPRGRRDGAYRCMMQR